MQREDSYGQLKRLSFVARVLQTRKPAVVLDIGCGTGAQLTVPLAQQFPDIRFVGLDLDPASIDYANRIHAHPNLRFLLPQDLESAARFELIIASEVLEHVEMPPSFLDDLARRLAPGGTLVLTVPNGYGPFEIMAFVESLLFFSGILPLLRSLKRRGARPPLSQGAAPMTLAISPHINFFSYRTLRKLLAGGSWQVAEAQARTIFCGFVFDNLIRGRLAELNARLADFLPMWCSSDWMLVAEPGSAAPSPAEWRPNAFARWRRALNRRRWKGVAVLPSRAC